MNKNIRRLRALGAGLLCSTILMGAVLAFVATLPDMANAQGGPERVTICHKPGTPQEKTITLPQPAAQRHLAHGDTPGAYGDVGCAHGLCEVGVALDPACDPCVEQVCDVDPFCCDITFDFICVRYVTTICDIPC